MPVPVEDYAYDGEGNRTASHLSNLYSSNVHNQLLEDDSYTYAYDAKGNRVSRTAKVGGGVESYTYDDQNRLVDYSSPTTTATYAYDAIDRRIAKTVNGVVTAYILDQLEPNTLDPSNNLLAFTNGTLHRRWLFSDATDEPLAFEEYSGTTVPGSGNVNGIFANHQGSVTNVVDIATGASAANYDYSGYGQRVELSASLNQPYGYTGRELDEESGLYHLRWRAYDPLTGTFLQMDPMGFSSGQENLYAYVDNDPFNLSDPMGLSAYIDYRMTIDGKKQMLGAATRKVSSGSFSIVGKMIEAMNRDWKNFAGSAPTIGQVAPGTGGQHHGNCGKNESGMHLYVIYSRETGRTFKIGIGNNKDLSAGGAQSKRALRQIPSFGGPTKAGHAVLMIVPDGLMARAQALILEKLMVTMIGNLGMEVDPEHHKSPKAGGDEWCL